MVTYNNLSFKTAYIEMYYDSTYISHGTGCLYKHNDSYYLITARHNFTGKDNNTEANLDRKYASIPNRIFLQFFFELQENQYIGGKIESLSLYSETPNRAPKPSWFVHPDKDAKIDIAALEIAKHQYTNNQVLKADTSPQIITVNPFLKSDALIGVGMDVFILGFPKKKFTGILPIWKSAMIASEYNFNVDNKKQFLVDTLTYKGMSGAPVFFYKTEGYISTNGTRLIDAVVIEFLGIYSGRQDLNEGNLQKDYDAAKLGIIWKKELIKEILDNGVFDDVQKP